MKEMRDITAEQEEVIDHLTSLKAFKRVKPRAHREGDDLILTFTVKGFFNLTFRHTYVVKDDGKVIKKKAKILKEVK